MEIRTVEKTYKKQEDIVKYDNRFNISNFHTLNSLHQNVFTQILKIIHERKDNEVVVNFDTLRNMSVLQQQNYTHEDVKEVFAVLSDKAFGIKVQGQREDGSIEYMSLFIRWLVSPELETSIITLNPYFANYFFDIPNGIGFTQFFLNTFIDLKSKYAKNLFRLFHNNKHGNKQEKWSVSIEEFRKIMNFPKSYNTGKILQILKNILPEIEKTGYFYDIQLTKIQSPKQGRPTVGFEFTYKTNTHKELELAGQTKITDYNYLPVTEEKTIETVETVIKTDENGLPVPSVVRNQEVVKEQKQCPYCGRPVIKRESFGKKNPDNKGRWYEKCEGNDGSKYCCKYFKWLDDISEKA